MAKKKRSAWSDGDDGGFNSPFAGLAPAATCAPASEKKTDATRKANAPQKTDTTLPKRAVVRLEKKGRGGKKVTVITHLALPTDALEQWALKLRKQLGCGGSVEGETVVLQGDQRKRTIALLETLGVKRVTAG